MRIHLLSLATIVVCAGCGTDATAPDAVDSGADSTPDTVLDSETDIGVDPAALILGVAESESWELSGLDGDVHVLRTEASIPHIYASNLHDLYMVQGFEVARDRYFEFELGRRLALGELSEILGDLALPTDVQSRGQGMTRIVERINSNLTEEEILIFDAFAEGVNQYIEAVKTGELPVPSELELAGPLLGLNDPTDLMTPIDRRGVLGFLGTIIFQLGYETLDVDWNRIAGTLDTLYEGAPLRELREAGLYDDIWERDDPVHMVSSAADFGLNTRTEEKSAPPTPPNLANGDARLPARATIDMPHVMLERFQRRADRFTRLLGHDGQHFGSNAWAVSSDGTSGGGAILAGDGHLPLGIPSIFYQVGMDVSVFGEDDYSVAGLLFAGLPVLGVGTNGHVAWSQTYLRGDITDWYSEELQLDDAGVPESSRFQGEWVPLLVHEERYEVASIVLLGSEGREENWLRWETFDGRPIVSVEGRTATPDEELAEGESLINVQGDLVVPQDLNDDGIISALSFDYTGFDIGDTIGAVLGFGRAQSVEEFRQLTRNLVVYAQNMVVADSNGDVLYTGFNATPCRSYLPREDDGRWIEGANPRMLIDGTTYQGFEIPITDDLEVDFSQGESDPYKCVIPFEDWPQALSPEPGFVLNANNDPGDIAFDGRLDDDDWYIGGPWTPGYRALTIHEGLTDAVANQNATVESMAALQGEHKSRLGLELAPYLIATIESARELAADDGDLGDADTRFVAIYESDSEALDEVAQRLSTWVERGANAASGVETFYNLDVTDDDRADAVATMVFAVWFREFVATTLLDEPLAGPLLSYGNADHLRLLNLMLEGRGPDDPGNLASWNAATGESVYWDVLGTDPIEESPEVILTAVVTALDWLRDDSRIAGEGGFGTEDMDQWLWGLRHMVVFQSIIAGFVDDNPAVDLLAGDLAIDTSRLPLADRYQDDDPRRGLQWFPRPGDWYSVDAGTPGLAHSDFFYTHGPVMRMVISLNEGRVEGQNIIPGGQSGVTASEHFDDQAAMWLGNQTVPLRFHVEDVVAGATGREVFSPAD